MACGKWSSSAVLSDWVSFKDIGIADWETVWRMHPPCVCDKRIADLFEKISISIYCTWNEHSVLRDLVHPSNCFSFVIFLSSAEGEIEKLWNESFTWCLGKYIVDILIRGSEREKSPEKNTSNCEIVNNWSFVVWRVCTNERVLERRGGRVGCNVPLLSAMLSSSYQVS